MPQWLMNLRKKECVPHFSGGILVDIGMDSSGEVEAESRAKFTNFELVGANQRRIAFGVMLQRSLYTVVLFMRTHI